MQRKLTPLEKERNSLLNDYIRARGSEKSKILVKIMDIDEQLELARPQKQKRRKIG